MATETLEQETRRLRDAIYGKQTEKNWENCKEDWMKDIEWLRKTAAKKL
jgi:hypothetical protein